MTPQISFEHVLAELSVNRQNPCEVIRELISNSYDALASKILMFPLVDENNGLIYFDNGTGLDQINKINDITPYEAFYSIGKSTKKSGDGIGYKCQGSKLCFASTRFALVTKTKSESHWWFKLIENPKLTITQTYDITPEKTEKPWQLIKNLFHTPTPSTATALDYLNEKFFITDFKQGTLLIIIGLQVENFKEFYSPQNKRTFQKSHLYNYIRFVTKHGDVRNISEPHGFKADHILQLTKTKGFNDKMSLYVMCDNELLQIPTGFPYLDIGEHQDKVQSPLNVSRLRDGRFHARFGRTIALHGVNYSFSIAIDGNRRALDEYSSLDRKGKKNSGIRLTDQRGTFISAHGIKICPYNELFDNPEFLDFAFLQDAEAITHFAFFIDGPFKLVTSRNSLSNESLKDLTDNLLLKSILEFLNDFKTSSTIFRELCQRLQQERADDKRESQVKYLLESKKGISLRERFMIKDIPLLDSKWFVSPEKGEEHWVGVLYSMLGNFVSEENKFCNFWLRPLTFASIGVIFRKKCPCFGSGGCPFSVDMIKV